MGNRGVRTGHGDSSPRGSNGPFSRERRGGVGRRGGKRGRGRKEGHRDVGVRDRRELRRKRKGEKRRSRSPLYLFPGGEKGEGKRKGRERGHLASRDHTHSQDTLKGRKRKRKKKGKKGGRRRPHL